MKKVSTVCFFISALACIASAQLAPALVNWDGQDNTVATLPKTLAETGFDKTNAALFKPYTVNVPQYRSFMQANRYIYLPAGQKITPTDSSNYVFPAGTVFIRDVYIDLTQGDPATRVFIETQFQILKANLEWSYLAYHYKKDGSTKIVTEEDGFIEESYAVNLNGKYPEFGAPTVSVGYTRAYGVCADCHKGGVNGFVTQQLNNGTQLNSLVAAGVLASAPNTAAWKAAGKVDQWYNWDHPTGTPAQKFFSYLAVNCSECHNPKNMEVEKEITSSFEYFSRMPVETFGGVSGAFYVNDTTASWGLTRMIKLEMPNGDEESIPDWTAVKHMTNFIKTGAIAGIHRTTPDKPSNFIATLNNNLLSFNRPGAAKLYTLSGEEISLKRLDGSRFIVTQPLTPGVYITKIGTHISRIKNF